MYLKGFCCWFYNQQNHLFELGRIIIFVLGLHAMTTSLICVKLKFKLRNSFVFKSLKKWWRWSNQLYWFLRASPDGDYLPVLFIDELSFRVRDLLVINQHLKLISTINIFIYTCMYSAFYLTKTDFAMISLLAVWIFNV